MLSMVDLQLLNGSYQFSLSEKNITYLGKGDVNSLYLGKTAQGQYVIKKINGTQQSRDFNQPLHLIIQSINFGESIAHQLLFTHQVCTAITQNNNCVINNEGQLLITYPYVHGSACEFEQISTPMVTQIAEFLKTLHHTQFHYDEAFARIKKESYYALGRRIIDHSFWNYIKKFLPAHFFRKLHAVSSYLVAHRQEFHDALSAPTQDVICHNDVKPKNVLWQDDSHFTVMDWEAVGLMDVTVDYLDTCLAWTTDYQDQQFSLNKEHARAFIKIYPIPGELSSTTSNLLILKWYFWLAFSISKVIKNPFTWRHYHEHIRTTLDFIDYLTHHDFQDELRQLDKE